MKKLFGIVFASVFLLGTVFTGQVNAQEGPAGLTVSGSGTFTFMPYQHGPDFDRAGTNDFAYANVNISGATENYGMNVGLGVSTDGKLNSALFAPGSPSGYFNDTGSTVITSSGGWQTSLWVKPVKILKIQGGFFEDYTLTGKVFASPFWLASYVTDAMCYNTVFTAFGAVQNATVSLTPVEGLFIAGSIPLDHVGPNSPDIEDTYKEIQAGAGYQIPNIGHARAQYVGKNRAVEVAFAFTGVENLTLDLGVKFATDGDDGIGRAALAGDLRRRLWRNVYAG